MFLFKQHVFLNHSESQVQRAYNRSMDSFIGDYYLGLLQKRIRTAIKRGAFNKLAVECLSKRAPFDDSDIKYDVLIPDDDDEMNKQKRIMLYEKRRQLLLRAAASSIETTDLA